MSSERHTSSPTVGLLAELLTHQGATMWIRMLLVVAVGVIALVLLKGHRGARHQAIRRLLLLGFTLVAGLSVLFPQAWQHAAEAVGVGRGTDLLLYALIVAFLGFVATSYLRFRDLQRQVTELARRLALDEAPDPVGLRAAALRAPVVQVDDVVPLLVRQRQGRRAPRSGVAQSDR